jgi:anti-sigma factor RsiW
MLLSCREATTLLPRFFDGELDARRMRAVALHGTRCAACESELRTMEHLQELVTDAVHGRVDTIDFEQFWTGVEAQLPPLRPSRWARLQVWWAEREPPWSLGLPAFAAVAALAILALLLFNRVQTTTPPGAPQVAVADVPASIVSLDTDGDSVAVVNDPETQTTILWVTDDKLVDGGTP